MSEASARIHRAESPGFGYPVTPADTGELLVVTRGFEGKPAGWRRCRDDRWPRDAGAFLGRPAYSTSAVPGCRSTCVSRRRREHLNLIRPTIGDYAQLVAWQRRPAAARFCQGPNSRRTPTAAGSGLAGPDPPRRRELFCDAPVRTTWHSPRDCGTCKLTSLAFDDFLARAARPVTAIMVLPRGATDHVLVALAIAAAGWITHRQLLPLGIDSLWSQYHRRRHRIRSR